LPIGVPSKGSSEEVAEAEVTGAAVLVVPVAVGVVAVTNRDQPSLLDVDAELWTEENLKRLREATAAHIPDIPPNATLEDLAAFLTHLVGYPVFSTPQDIESVIKAHFGCLNDPDGV
jgi:hypothetical protein